MYFIDTHCHIYSTACENIEMTIKKAISSNVRKMINCAENIKTSKEIIELSKKNSGVLFPAIGIHPEYANEADKNEFETLEMMLVNNKIIAIGEIGLDYHYTKENREEQIKLFRKQLEIAENYKLPVIIHSRDATKDTIEILKEYNVKGVIHSFSGSYETAIEYIKMGFLLGINGVVTFKNSNLKDVLLKLDLEKIILETDSPFLSPHPLRGKVNSPENIPIIGEFIAKLYGVSIEKVAEITSKNASRIFDI